MSEQSTRTEETKAVAGAAEDDASIQRELLLNHEYDGIREYDNPMPRWWKWIFWGSFYFAIGYVFHYHIGNGVSIAAGYEADVTEAREREAQAVMGTEVTEESLRKLMADEKMMADAGKLFLQRCAQCHGNHAEGLIGPNLTDEYWIHTNGSLLQLYELIGEGVLSKGMPAWKRQLRPVELGKLAAFVGSISNTNVKGPKPPEGRKITPGSAEAAGGSETQEQHAAGAHEGKESDSELPPAEATAAASATQAPPASPSAQPAETPTP